MFVRAVINRLTPAVWNFVNHDTREAFISEKAFSVCRSQVSGSVSVETMDELLRAMLVEAGLLELDPTPEKP